MTIAPLSPAGTFPAPDVRAAPAAAPGGGGPFARVIDHVLGKVNVQQTEAQQAVQSLATGQTDNVHNVLLAVAKADLSFRLFLEIRNRLTEAFQEIMRMQV